MLKSRNLIQPEDFSVREIDEILNLAEDIMKNPSAYSRVCEGKLMATLFYEPSTRTRLSFEAAMKRLGGEIIGFSEPNSSEMMISSSFIHLNKPKAAILLRCCRERPSVMSPIRLPCSCKASSV